MSLNSSAHSAMSHDTGRALSALISIPPLAWRVHGVLPTLGWSGLYGPSASGKSFLALDIAVAIASGNDWFDCRVEASPDVHCALEGEGGNRRLFEQQIKGAACI